MTATQPYPVASSVALYQSSDGGIELSVKSDGETVWLTQSQMAILFERDRTVISRHIKNIFKEGELDENITYANFAHLIPYGALPHVGTWRATSTEDVAETSGGVSRGAGRGTPRPNVQHSATARCEMQPR